MWASLTCMFYASVPNSNYIIDSKGLLSTFTILVYILVFLFFFFFSLYYSSLKGKGHLFTIFVLGLVGICALSFVVEKWVPYRCGLWKNS